MRDETQTQVDQAAAGVASAGASLAQARAAYALQNSRHATRWRNR
jgi:hypothetical protein